MNKQTAFILAAWATAVQADEQTTPLPAPPPAAQAEPQQTLPTYDEHYRNTLSTIDALNSILSAVKDKASAEQAAEQAFAIYGELYKIPLAPIIKQTSDQELRRVETQYADRKEKVMQQLQQRIRNIAMYEGYTSDRMCEFIVKLEEDRWIAPDSLGSSNVQTDPAKLQTLEQEIPALFDKTFEEQETLNNLLQTIQDTASADAAANKLNAFMQKMEAERDRIVANNGLPPRNLLDRIMSSRMQRMEAIQTATESIRKKLEQQNYYDSETLKTAIRQFSHLY